MPMKDRIIPIPRSYTKLPGDPVVLGVPGKAGFRLIRTIDSGSGILSTAAALLCEKLRGLLNVCPEEAAGPVPITLTLADAPQGVCNSEQGYALRIEGDGVTVTGFGETGLLYGVVTLVQCLELRGGELLLEPCEILDWPDLRTRGHFMESRYGSNLMTLHDWEHVVDHMLSMKQNQLVISVYGCWCVQYDGRVSEYLYLPIHRYPDLRTPVVRRYWSPARNAWVDEETDVPMVREDFFGDLIAYGRARGVEVLPLFNSYGHNTLIPRLYPEVSAKNEDGTPTFHGFCTHNEKTYEMMFGIYDEIIDRYLKPNGIESFHMGLDEVHGGNACYAPDIQAYSADISRKPPFRDARCHCPACRDAEKEDLYIEHAVRLMKHLKERGMKNIYMYSDMLVRRDWGDEEHDSTEKMMRAIKEAGLEDAAVIDWWTYSDYQKGLMFQSTRPEQGLRRTVKPWNGYYHWNMISYPLKNVYLLAKMAHEEGCEGLQSYSAWDESYDRVHVAQADYAWCFENCGLPDDVTRSYARARFGAQYEPALRALGLQDAMLSTAGPEDLPSNYNILMGTLSYYFYSYVREGVPYPRSFPGEPMSKLLGAREFYEKALLSLNAMAREAGALWEEIAQDERVDTRMARRYAWDARHIEVLTGDFLALLRMYDLYGTGSVCACRAAKMADIALERKLSRLRLMSAFERTKEDFLAASHLRNHSIYMQFFADLEAYLRRTPAQDITLDFTDFSPLESEAFKKLR